MQSGAELIQRSFAELDAVCSDLLHDETMLKCASLDALKATIVQPALNMNHSVVSSRSNTVNELERCL